MAATVVPFPRKFVQPHYAEPFEAEYLEFMSLPEQMNTTQSVCSIADLKMRPEQPDHAWLRQRRDKFGRLKTG